MKTNAEEAITAIAKALLDYSRTDLVNADKDVDRAVESARMALMTYGIPVYPSSSAFVGAKRAVYKYIQGLREDEITHQ